MQTTTENILVEMIEVRRRSTSWLRRPKPAGNWPMFELWRSPEAAILDTIEGFHWIRDSGLSDKSALETLAARIGEKHGRTLHADFTIRQLVVNWLKVTHPLYSPSSEKVLDQQLEIADSWVLNEIQSIRSQPPYPPIEWLEEQMLDIDEIDAGNSRDWHRLKMRFTEYDELWKFCSPSEYWAGLAGRAGIALVRNGRPIAHVTTVMN